MGFLEIISSIFIMLGVFFMLISSVGLIKLHDFYIRNSASTKAIALGILLILLGLAIYYNDTVTFIELLAIFLFIFLITPLSAHVIARAAIKVGVPFWDKTNLKELEKYEEEIDKIK